MQVCVLGPVVQSQVSANPWLTLQASTVYSLHTVIDPFQQKYFTRAPFS